MGEGSSTVGDWFPRLAGSAWRAALGFSSVQAQRTWWGSWVDEGAQMASLSRPLWAPCWVVPLVSSRTREGKGRCGEEGRKAVRGAPSALNC